MSEPANRGKRYPADVLRRDEVEALLNACGSSARGARNKALLAVLWRTGARIGEALALRPLDVNIVLRSHEGHTMRILRPKGFGRGVQPRVLGLDQTVCAFLCDWLELRSYTLLEDDDALFCSHTGKPLDTSYFRHLLPRLAQKAGITRRVHPHIFRHTFAFDCAMEGKAPPWIQRALGHSSLSVTIGYMEHLAPTDVIADMQGRG